MLRERKEPGGPDVDQLTLNCGLIGQPTGSLASEQRANNCWSFACSCLEPWFRGLGLLDGRLILGVGEVAAFERDSPAGIVEEDQPSTGSAL